MGLPLSLVQLRAADNSCGARGTRPDPGVLPSRFWDVSASRLQMLLPRPHSTRLHGQSEHCCACSRPPPLAAARLAPRAGLVVVQAPRRARCGSGERGHAHQTNEQAASKDQSERTDQSRRRKQVGGRDRAPTANPQSTGPTTLCGDWDQFHSSNRASGPKGTSQRQ